MNSNETQNKSIATCERLKAYESKYMELKKKERLLAYAEEMKARTGECTL